MGFPVHYGSPRDVFAASSSFVDLYILRIEEKRKTKQQRWWQTQLYISGEVYSGSSLLNDFLVD
jgi:hypothetical protein